MNKLDIIYIDDWCGLYIDGKLYYEGHSIEPETVLNAIDDSINFPWTCGYRDDIDELFLNNKDEWGNRFPDNIEEFDRVLGANK